MNFTKTISPNILSYLFPEVVDTNNAGYASNLSTGARGALAHSTCLLMDPYFVFDKDTHLYYNDIKEHEIEQGNGYIGKVLSMEVSFSITPDPSELHPDYSVNGPTDQFLIYAWSHVFFVAKGGPIARFSSAIFVLNNIVDAPVAFHIDFNETIEIEENDVWSILSPGLYFDNSDVVL
jgi:hypothetical protein